MLELSCVMVGLNLGGVKGLRLATVLCDFRFGCEGEMVKRSMNTETVCHSSSSQ